MTDEYFIFDRYTRTDEGMARDLAAPAYPGPALNLDESAQTRVLADLTTV